MDSIEVALPNGHIIKHCGTRLLAKYLNGPRSLVFDLYAAGQTSEQRHRLSWVDAVVTESMYSRLGCEDWLRLTTADVRLDGLDPTWSFEDYPSHKEAILDAYVNVHRALRLQPGSSAQVFKLLALKWPRLIPMIDNAVGAIFSTVPNKKHTAITTPWPVHRDVEKRWQEAKTDPKLVAEFYLAEFEFAFDRVENLTELSDWLGKKVHATTSIQLNLSPIRILDSLIWLEAKKRKLSAERWNGIDCGTKDHWCGENVRSYVNKLLALSSVA